MPPAKKAQDEPRIDRTHSKDRTITSNTAATNGRSRRNGQSSAYATVPTKNPAPATTTTSDSKNGAAVPSNVPTGISWASEDPALLNSYRSAYNLPVPGACRCIVNTAVLTVPGIGRHSPTMARKKEKRKTSQEQLARAVRRHFNGLAVNETDVVIDFLYKAKNTDKAFRMRFTPPKAPKPS